MAQHALADTNVLFGAFDRRDQFHEVALPLVNAADRGELPMLVIIDFVLAETMNALNESISHAEVLRAMSMLEASTGFVFRRTSEEVWRRGSSIFETYEHLSFVDSMLVSQARCDGVNYLYSYDGGFDDVDGITRLNTKTNPFSPGG